MYNTERLKDERISKEYKEKLESALQAVGTSDRVSCVMAEEIIGFEEKRQWKGWIDQECEKAKQEKNAAYRRTLEERCIRVRYEEYRSKRHEEKRIQKKKEERITGGADEEIGEDRQY